MTVSFAKLNYFRMQPRKVRIVAKMIKNLPVKIAEQKLLFSRKKASLAMLKLLKSAVSNAKNRGYFIDDLYVKNVIVNEGPKHLKRYYPKARGQVGLITRKMAHLEIYLDKLENKK